MNIFLTGSSTILGSALIESFHKEGHSILVCDQRLADSDDQRSEIASVIGEKQIDLVFLLHGGEHLKASFLRKKITTILEKQLELSAAICSFFTSRKSKPAAIFTASSVHLYKKTGKEPSIETSPRNEEFPAVFYRQLENSALPAASAGIRVVHLRMDKLISRKCPPAAIRVPFFGSCSVFFRSRKTDIGWCSEGDAVRAVNFLTANDKFSGPINLVSGDSLPLKDFNNVVSGYFKLQPPKSLPLFTLKILFGKKYTSMLTVSTKSVPFKLMEEGFIFGDISLAEYLRKDG